MNKQLHWEEIYRTKDAKGVSWYAPRLESSLKVIESAKLGFDAHIIDVGGGASTLVDDLVGLGYKNLTVLDISSEALARTKVRLGTNADFVE